ERLHDRVELEVAAGLLRVPHVGINTVWHVHHTEAVPLARCRQRLCRGGGNHRVEQWQSDRHARAAQEGAAIQVLLRDEHLATPSSARPRRSLPAAACWYASGTESCPRSRG